MKQVTTDVRAAVSARLLLLLLLLPGATAYWTLAGINLGRGYDLILGNPFFLHPGQEEISEAQDPGIKETRVLAANEEKIKQEAEKQPEGLVTQCTSVSAYTLRPREFRHRMVRDMFFDNPLTRNWHYELKDHAISGDGTARFPKNALFLDEYHRCALVQEYAAEEAQMSQVTPDFTRAVCALPDQYQEDAYRHFISSYGTSVITRVKLGTLEIRRYMKTFTNMRSTRQQLATGQPNIYRNGHQSSMFIKLTENMLNRLNKSEIKKEPESLLHWMVGSPIFPSAIKLGVENVDTFIDEKYWPACEESCCERLGTVRENVVRALKAYAVSRADHHKLAAEPLYPVKWPRGTYTMIQSGVGEGCPAGSGVSWAKGKLTHAQGLGTKVQGATLAVPNIISATIRRREIHRMDARHKRGFGPAMGSHSRGNTVKVVNQKFCTKRQSSADEPLWPKGSYCIYKHGHCPQGFESGWIYWDDVYSTKNSHSGILPDGVYNSNTQIYFCCREDGSPVREIILPLSEPFTLMRVGKRCQNVKWAKSIESSVLFDGHWTTSWFENGYFMGGAHPDNEINFSNNKLFYCMYRADTSQVITNLSVTWP